MGYLDNVPEENSFGLSNGQKVRTLEELLSAVKNSDNALFYNHVTPDRNDFANWIKFCVRHEALYVKIFDVRQRDEFIRILDQEIDFIKNPRLAETAEFFKEKPNLPAAQPLSPAQPQTENLSKVQAFESLAQENLVQEKPAETQPAQAPPAQTSDQDKKNTQGSQPDAKADNPSIVQAVSDIALDFEQVFRSLIDDIEKEILSWE